MSVFFTIFIGIRIDLLSLQLVDILRCSDTNQTIRLKNNFC
jgi:hypothetical protein